MPLLSEEKKINLDELYQSISGFWNQISPVIVAHVLGLMALRWIGGVKWHILEKIEYRLETDGYKRWRRIFDEFNLRPKIPYLMLLAFLLYFVLFSSLLGLFSGFSPVSIVYSETEFWRESRPLQEIVAIGSYGSSADLHYWNILQLKSKFLEEFKGKYPERYRSLIGWLTDSYSKWEYYYKLSMLFFLFVMALFFYYFREGRNRSWRLASRFSVLLLLSILVIMISRYKAEQYIERQLQAEIHFVAAQLELDPQMQQNRLCDKSIEQLKYQIYEDLKATDRQAPDRFWLSRLTESLLPRAFVHITDEEFQQKYKHIELQGVNNQ